MKKKWKRYKNKGFKIKIGLLMCAFYLHTNKLIVYADTKSGEGIASSKAGTGLTKLFGDLGAFILTLTLPVAGVCAGYFFLRLNAADEGDQKQWKKRLWLTLFCAIGSFAIGGILTTVTGYFK